VQEDDKYALLSIIVDAWSSTDASAKLPPRRLSGTVHYGSSGACLDVTFEAPFDITLQRSRTVVNEMMVLSTSEPTEEVHCMLAA
jgi:hypothetical protein